MDISIPAKPFSATGATAHIVQIDVRKTGEIETRFRRTGYFYLNRSEI